MRSDCPLFRSIQTLLSGLALSCAALTCVAAADNNGGLADIDIPYQKFVLDNGLTLIVHEDHKAPLVAVNLWYHVGSKNEKPGQTGFAHLFEHLMFNGSEHFNDEYFRPFEKAGATDQNGTTSNDRTNYFATVPKPALDLALWMESDRMAHLLPAIDQAKLDEQRGVVKNEKRQGEDRPFGKVWAHIAKHTYPAGHPYSWLPIGSMEDLDAAKLDDVHDWFKQYYGPNNAVLVIAGDIDAQAARQRVEHFFGSIPPGPALQQSDSWIAKRSEEQRATLRDRVPNARVYLVWNTPRATDPESTRFDLIADLLAGDASSLLNKRLVQEKKLATNIDAANFNQELAGQFWIIADVAAGVEPLELEREIRRALADFKQREPSAAELARARVGYRAALLRRLEKIGGFSGKADLLAAGQVYAGDPAYYRRELKETETVSAKQLRDTARAWLDEGVYVLHVLPQPALKAGVDTVDRSRVPEPGFAPDPNVPAVQRAQLANGMQLILLRRPELPLVELEWQLPVGRNVDGWQRAGLSDFTLDMLLEGNGGLDSAAIAARIRDLGAEIETYTRTDSAGVRLSALKENIDGSTELFARLLRQPDFPAEAVDRLRAQTLARIGREESDGARLAQRVLPRLVFGIDDPDSGPLAGTGRRDVIAAIDRGQLQGFHQRWFNPARTTLIAVGDLTLQQLQQLAERNFTDSPARAQGDKDKRGANWPSASGPIPDDGSATARSVDKATLYFIDNPGSSQANISAALAMPSLAGEADALILANAVLGGGFTSRLNLNLREDKHWSYGMRSGLVESRGRQLWIASGNVQIDKTGAALQELRREMRDMNSATRPIAAEEFDKVREQRIRQLPGAYDTNRQLLEAVSRNVELRRADDYPATEGSRLRALDLDALRRQASALSPDAAVWLAVGDRQKILPQLQQLGWDRIVELDKQGEPIER
jgi:zinc protease